MQILEFLNSAGQKSAAERTVRNKGDSQFTASCQHSVRFHVSRPQRVFTLQRSDSMDLIGPAQDFRTRFAQADVPDFAFFYEFGHRAHSIFNRDIGVDSMLVIEIDGLDAKALQTSFAGPAHIRRRAVHSCNSIRTEPETEFCSHYNFAA